MGHVAHEARRPDRTNNKNQSIEDRVNPDTVQHNQHERNAYDVVEFLVGVVMWLWCVET